MKLRLRAHYPHRHTVTAAQVHDELSSSLVETSSALFELLKSAVAVAIVATLIHSLVATVAIVDGPSMLPSYPSGSLILVNRLDGQSFSPGDVVQLRYPGDPLHHTYIKRIVAGPGDRIAIGATGVFRNGTKLIEPYLAAGTVTAPDVAQRTLGSDEYYTLGDNRTVSNDSRFFGPVARRFMVGRVLTTLTEPK